MADHIPVRMFLEQILNLLDETMENTKAMYLDSGTSLFETLATITAEEASKPVSPYCGSLAAQIAHVQFFIDVHERHVRGEKLGKLDWGEVWRTRPGCDPRAVGGQQSQPDGELQEVCRDAEDAAL